MVVILTAAIGTVTVSASVLPFLTGALGQKPTGNFLLTVNPSSLTIMQGGSALSTITVVSVGGFKGTVALYTDSVGGSFRAERSEEDKFQLSLNVDNGFLEL